MDIVLVGACYLDTILSVSHYPEEDTKLRASSIETRRGGNCPNTLDVLQQLIAVGGRTRGQGDKDKDKDKNKNKNKNKKRMHLLSCLPSRDSPASQQIAQSFGHASAVSLDHCIYRDTAVEAASSYIIRSRATGSRTLVNYNPLDEMTTAEFAAVAREFDAQRESWWHFEGRIPETTLECMLLLRRTHPRANISVEVEKPGRPGLGQLAAEADVVFYSKTWAEHQGHDSAEACLNAEPRGRAYLTVCPWGAEGAYAVSHRSGEQIRCAVEQSADEIRVVDSVGAGDTLIAGMLYGLTCRHGRLSDDDDEANWDVRRCVRFAVEVATLKVQREGFAGLGKDMMGVM